MSSRPEKATIVIQQKLILNKGLIREIKVWKIPKSDRYTMGFKYRLVLVNPKNNEVILLFDNHWPKGPHLHRKDKEYPYDFEGLEKLMKDFLKESSIEEKRYHEDKKN